MNKIFLSAILLLCFWSIATAQMQTFPNVSLVKLNGESYTVPQNTAKGLFFFDTTELQNPDFFQTLNSLGYAFQNYDLELLAIYSELESAQALQSKVRTLAQKQPCFFKFYVDPQRQALLKLGFTKAPTVTIVHSNNHICYSKDTIEPYPVLYAYTQLALSWVEQVPAYVTSSTTYSFASDAETQAIPKTILWKQAMSTSEPIIPQPQPGQPEVPAQPEVTTSQPNAPETATPPVTATTPPVTATPSVTEIPSPNKASDSFRLLATMTSPQTIGYEPIHWGWVKSLENFVFFFLFDFLVKIVPLLIWGWGALFCLARIRKYSGAWWGWLVCSILFLQSLAYVWTQLPVEICILAEPLWVGKCWILYYAAEYIQFAIAWNVIAVFLVVISLAGSYKQPCEKLG